MITRKEFEVSDLDRMKEMYDGDQVDWRKYAKIHEVLKPSLTFEKDGEALLSCGVTVYRPGFAEAWIYLSKAGGKNGSVLMAAKRQLEEWIRDLSLIRVQAIVRADWEKGERFLRWVGMEKEGRLRRYFPDESDAFVYARTK
jgi:RimJ/RimL family protein N-acetyltransferase